MKSVARQTIPAVVALLVAFEAPGQTIVVPNASFEDGQDAPAGWKLAGAGRWLEKGAAAGGRAVAVAGTGTDSSTWQSAPLKLEPFAVYALRFKARSLGSSGGTAVTGPGFCNRDLGKLPAAWTDYQSYFVTPSEPGGGQGRLRFGQWHVKGTVAFDDVRLVRAVPVYARRGQIALGAGESIRPDGKGAGEYAFLAPLGRGCGNHSRPLAHQQCHFNSNRWCLVADSVVVYRHEVAGRRQSDAKVEVSVTWHAGGELVVEAAGNGKDWRGFGTLAGLGSRSFDIPGDLQPAQQVWVRLTARPVRGEDAKRGCSLQVSRYAYTAGLDGPPVSMVGRTHFVAFPHADGRLKVAIEGLGDGLPGGRNTITVRITNTSPRPVTGTLEAATIAPGGAVTGARQQVTLPRGTKTHRIGYSLERAGKHKLRLTLTGGAAFSAETTLHVAILHDASYGRALPGSNGAAALWWASSGWKVSRSRPAPKARGEAIVIRAAGNEAEAAQLVVRPVKALRGFRAAVAAVLRGPGGATIPAANVEILRVRYVRVAQPTDRTGVCGDWPDPLPPLTGPIDLPAGKNQPLWVRVKVPRGAAPGAYTGTIRLTAEAPGARKYRARVHLRVEVYGFDLPDRMTCTTSFGFSPNNVWRYQKVRDEAQKRTVLEKYLANFSEHHISPYNPAPLDPMRVTWPGVGDWRGGSRDRSVAHSGKSSLKVEDRSKTGSAGATYGPRIRIPPGGVRLRFHYRTGTKGHRFIVTLNHHDASGKWMSGRNNDMRITGDGTWQAFDRVVRKFPEGAKSVRLTLWPCLYSEEGKTTGAVWYDDLSLCDRRTGEQLVRLGGFEPIAPEKLAPRFDFSAWDAAMKRAVDRYHFNSFMVRVQGMGGGSFHARTQPSLLGYAENTPEYQAAFANYCRALQEHLRKKGWLDEAFVYWFDEPDPKDYAFVNNGFRKLKAAAPHLRRMLTEQVEEALVGGPDIWCPVTPNYNHKKAEARRKHGETFWWYVCCGPKAPYCTLFIDHPATELRVWLWQTFQRGIDGILVWQTNCWTSSAAYPDRNRPQNPYEDPMGWVSGYSTPKGTRRAWGNGDGRFIYPPEAAATGRQNETVLDGPVDSIRWEMLRDGIEDYEYLALLRRLLEARGKKLSAKQRDAYAALLTVPQSITRNMTTFTKDPAPLEQHRHAVAGAIETLSKK